jgi:flagellar hook assembly protein FlgD
LAGAVGNSLVAARSLSAWPLPYRGGSLQVAFASAMAGARTEVAIFDLSGRRVRVLSGESGTGSLRWDGKDTNGIAVRDGIYFLRATDGARSAQLKFAVIQ